MVTFYVDNACGYHRPHLKDRSSTAGPKLPHPLRILGEVLRYTMVFD